MPAPGNLIVPVFIPHSGCPHRCVFCNQNEISGTDASPAPEEVKTILERRLGPDTPHAIVAFYGGSFTGMPLEAQEAYLDVAAGFVSKGFARGIRVSTRPDYVDAGTATFLERRGVVTVELGVQSLDDEVLRLSGRGHTAGDAYRASVAIKEAGIELGIQLMAGLPGDTPEKFLHTVEETIAIGPALVRIYPALVVSGAPLEQLFRRGEFTPLTLEEAVSLCAKALKKFRAAGIKVIRLGLQPSRELEKALLAGPYHPSFGHLVESEIALERMAAEVKGGQQGVEFAVHPSELSVYKGIGGENVGKLSALGGGLKVLIKGDASVQKGDIRAGRI